MILQTKNSLGRKFKSLGLFIPIFLILFSGTAEIVNAQTLSQEQKNIYKSGIYHYDKQPFCASTLSTVATGAITEYPDQVDPSLVNQLKEIRKNIEPNLAQYQAAASRWGIPWQAIAATHWREGMAGSNKSMVNGTSLPSKSDLKGREYIWGSADARISTRSTNKEDIPIGNGGAPARRFYGTLVQDIDYATWLLIEHGTRLQFGGDPNKLIEKAQTSGLTKNEWMVTWGSYLGAISWGYGNFGLDKYGRMGAGAIMAYFGGLKEKPPVPSVKYPGKSDSDYTKVENGVTGTASSSSSSANNSCGQGSEGGSVNTNGYSWPVEPQRKSYVNNFPGSLTHMPCDGAGSCHGGRGTGTAYDLGSVEPSYTGNKLEVSAGKKVYAINAGSIVNLHIYNGIQGCYSLQLKAEDGYYYWYGHIAKPLVKDGQTNISAGQAIAEIGGSKCTGNGSTAHLHIDRGPKGEFGGSESNRDGEAMVKLMNSLFEELPE